MLVDVKDRRSTVKDQMLVDVKDRRSTVKDQMSVEVIECLIMLDIVLYRFISLVLLCIIDIEHD
jgi:hypothetical protein